MAALANLAAATNRLTKAVDRIVDEWNKPNPTEEQIQAASDAVDAQSARIEALPTLSNPS